MAKTETLHKQEFYKMCSYTTLTALLKIIIVDSQCKEFITSAYLSISLSYSVVFNASITVLWKQHYFKSWFLLLGILIIFVPCSCLGWPGNVSQHSNIPDSEPLAGCLGRSYQLCLKPTVQGRIVGTVTGFCAWQPQLSLINQLTQVALMSNETSSASEVTANVYNMLRYEIVEIITGLGVFLWCI